MSRPFMRKTNRISDAKSFIEQNPIDNTLSDQRASLELHGCLSSMTSALRRSSKDSSTEGHQQSKAQMTTSAASHRCNMVAWRQSHCSVQ